MEVSLIFWLSTGNQKIQWNLAIKLSSGDFSKFTLVKTKAPSCEVGAAGRIWFLLP
jgi:hypothetical protein